MHMVRVMQDAGSSCVFQTSLTEEEVRPRVTDDVIGDVNMVPNDCALYVSQPQHDPARDHLHFCDFQLDKTFDAPCSRSYVETIVPFNAPPGP